MIDFTRRAKTIRSEAFEKRLASYGAMAIAAALGGAVPANAGIIHHDPGDITTPLNGFLGFNMTSGAVTTNAPTGMNFRILWSTFRCTCTTTSSSVTVPLTYTSRFARVFGSGSYDGVASSSSGPFRLIASANVNGTSFWYGGTLAAESYFFGTYGNWVPGSTGASGFLGLIFRFNGNTHYGWANITVNPDYSTTLHSFAYEACPDEGIHVGSTSGGVSCDSGAVPEPHSAALMALGAAGLVALRRRRKRA